MAQSVLVVVRVAAMAAVLADVTVNVLTLVMVDVIAVQILAKVIA